MLNNIAITSNFIAMLAGIFLSLVFSYFPKLNTWYAALEEGTKKLIMLLALVLTTGALFGLGCLQVITINGFACNKLTVVSFIQMLIIAIIANQGIFKITPATDSVNEAKS